MQLFFLSANTLWCARFLADIHLKRTIEDCTRLLLYDGYCDLPERFTPYVKWIRNENDLDFNYDVCKWILAYLHELHHQYFIAFNKHHSYRITYKSVLVPKFFTFKHSTSVEGIKNFYINSSPPLVGKLFKDKDKFSKAFHTIVANTRMIPGTNTTRDVIAQYTRDVYFNHFDQSCWSKKRRKALCLD